MSQEGWRSWDSQNSWSVIMYGNSLIMRMLQDIMDQLESVGWQKVTRKDAKEMTELDISKVFKMIDVDKSGSVSRTVG